MNNVLNQSNMTLRDRLKMHVGFSVAVSARGFTSEPGLLQKVGAQFIRVNGQWFVPAAQNQISLLGFEPTVTGKPVYVRTTYRGSFAAKLVRTGTDFVELLVAGKNSEEWLLVPVSRIVSLEMN